MPIFGKMDYMENKMDEMKKQLEKMLTKKRFDHSIGVMDEAVLLAVRYGADVKKAQIAGLVHDCCKNMSYDELLIYAQGLGIEIDEISLANEKLIHATVGAKYAGQIFKIEDSEILDAIAYHTTGRADMTLLDKIIYIADYIEPTRKDYPWLIEMRRLAYENLDEAVLYGLDIAIGYLIEDRLLIHKDTIDARNDLLFKLAK